MRKKDQKALFGVMILCLIVFGLLYSAYSSPTVLEYEDSGRDLSLGINQELIISLPPGGSLGGWTVERYDRQVLSLVEEGENSWRFLGSSLGRCELIIRFRGVDEEGERPRPFRLDITVF